MMAELLLEIGTEEIPSGYLENGLREFKTLAEKSLKDNRIDITGDLETYGTPRRLILIGKAVSERQEDIDQEITGPPKKAAFDKDGNPTRAAIGFAKKHGVSIDDVEILATPKGEYLHIKRVIAGRTAIDVFSEILPKIVSEIPWPKSMRWGSGDFSFVRPIHWILALFDGKVIPFELADVKSDNETSGHRFMAPGRMKIDGFSDYREKLKRSSVIIDQKHREREVEEKVLEAAKGISGFPVEDPDLVTTVANLVEFPSVVCGEFDADFLKIPDPVLITAMKQHQRYFSIRDREGRLMSHFVAVNNTVARDESVVQKGHERVLRARLADADFFFKEDRKRPLEERLEDLKKVIYQAKLGTSYAKVCRFTSLAEFLAEQVAPERVEEAKLSARLCKCDLVTEMVMEFPSLQGVMGGEYAHLDGHPEDICRAIHEHYLPVRAGGDLPTSVIGAVVGVADRLDTIAGCFAVGLQPTGAADPFALRRHALAIIRILEEMGWDVSLRELISRSLSLLNESVKFDRDPVFEKVVDFFRERYKNMMLGAGFTSDTIEAIISAGFDHIYQLRFRIQQLQKFMESSDEAESLVLTSKRIKNILKKQEESFAVNPDYFQETVESGLWKIYSELKDEVGRQVGKNRYLEALNLVVQLRKPVDDLFDQVEILTRNDPRLRENRVAVLQDLERFFRSLADFSKFSI